MVNSITQCLQHCASLGVIEVSAVVTSMNQGIFFRVRDHETNKYQQQHQHEAVVENQRTTVSPRDPTHRDNVSARCISKL